MVFLRIPDVGNPLGEPEIDSPGREREIVSPPTTDVPNPQEPPEKESERRR
jgi:hypothetical protein